MALGPAGKVKEGGIVRVWTFKWAEMEAECY